MHAFITTHRYNDVTGATRYSALRRVVFCVFSQKLISVSATSALHKHQLNDKYQ